MDYFSLEVRRSGGMGDVRLLAKMREVKRALEKEGIVLGR
jgi:hypothetical protein